MVRWRSVLWSAIVMAIGLGVSPASAQRYEATLRSLDYGADPTARSPRLLSMGSLTLADDLHNHIGLWDFAGSPTGIAHAESVSVLEYRPGRRSSSGLRHLWPDTREHQLLAAQQSTHGIEAWRRTPGGTAFGVAGEVSTLQRSRPFNGSVEERERFLVPILGGAVNGRVPWVPSTRFDYALRAGYSHEGYKDLYFDMLQLPEGDYLGRNTGGLPPPDVFTPNHSDVSSVRFGTAFSMRVTSGITVALGYDHDNLKLVSTNQSLRSASETDERRPFNIAQASLVGRVGHHFEFGADGRAWRSESEEFFRWSVSAGQTELALAGRGKRLSREEAGTLLRTRARWVAGPLELGAGVNTSFWRQVITPWYPVRPDDPQGFNDFLDEVGRRPGADTLLLPARVPYSRVKENGVELVGGAAWRLPGARGMMGAEVHRWRRRFDQRFVGTGPEPSGWEVRAGAEYRCGASFLARAGWGYGLFDADHLSADNTDRHASAAAGFGYQPVGSRWTFDLAYALVWVNPDFADLTGSHETRRRLAIQSRWVF